uniref:Laminin EGF-like domain-containing protein n=1 Tax=Spermophilus dauricus TaxID=99837 RepID=A0A8C9PXX5_SPEDA
MPSQGGTVLPFHRLGNGDTVKWRHQATSPKLPSQWVACCQGHSHLLPGLLPTACNCSGRSEECTFDRELFRSTGHGGHCHHCRDHTAGPHCERCAENFYHWDQRKPCQPCDCHPAGSLRLQCDDVGTCVCKPTVTGWKCDRCLPGFHSLSEGGCR